MLINQDLRTLIEFNSLIPVSRLGAKLFWFLSNNSIVRALPVFLSLPVLWFREDDNSPRRRARIALGITGVFVALAISVTVQGHFALRFHPSIDPALNLKGKGLDILPSTYGRPWSFPSDTATHFFGLCAVVFLVNRTAGAICFGWCLVTVGFLRIALGWHYPTDVLAGIALGAGLVILLTRIKPLTAWVEHLLERSRSRMYLVHSMFLLIMAEAYSVFPGVEDVLKSAKIAATAIFN